MNEKPSHPAPRGRRHGGVQIDEEQISECVLYADLLAVAAAALFWQAWRQIFPPEDSSRAYSQHDGLVHQSYFASYYHMKSI